MDVENHFLETEEALTALLQQLHVLKTASDQINEMQSIAKESISAAELVVKLSSQVQKDSQALVLEIKTSNLPGNLQKINDQGETLLKNIQFFEKQSIQLQQQVDQKLTELLSQHEQRDRDLEKKEELILKVLAQQDRRAFGNWIILITILIVCITSLIINIIPIVR